MGRKKKASWLVRAFREFPVILIFGLVALGPMGLVWALVNADLFWLGPNPNFVPHDAFGLVCAGLAWMVGLLIMNTAPPLRRIFDNNPPPWRDTGLFVLGFISGGFLGYRAGPDSISRNGHYLAIFFGLLFLALCRKNWILGYPKRSLESKLDTASPPDNGLDPAETLPIKSLFLQRLWIFRPFFVVGLSLLLVSGIFGSNLQFFGGIILFSFPILLLHEGKFAISHCTVRHNWWPLWVFHLSLNQTLLILFWAWFGVRVVGHFHANPGGIIGDVLLLIFIFTIQLQGKWANSKDREHDSSPLAKPKEST